MTDPARSAFGRRTSPPTPDEPSPELRRPVDYAPPAAPEPVAELPASFASEQRTVPRARTLQSGRLLLNDEGDGFDCTVRDLSIAGAGIRFRPEAELPRQSRLLMIREGLLFDCTLVWRQDDRAGLRFTGRHDLREAGRDYDSVRQLWKMLAGR